MVETDCMNYIMSERVCFGTRPSCEVLCAVKFWVDCTECSSLYCKDYRRSWKRYLARRRLVRKVMGKW